MAAAGTITRSLFLDGLDAGLSEKLIMQLAKIFAWDIDFDLQVRKGDRFKLIYEQLGPDGETGEILAAEFVNRRTSYRAFRYIDSAGRTDYYSPDGHAVRKSFLRSPVNFRRISSHFDLLRKHPVLNKIRAHRGVDYAAKAGTPVIASGDGCVHFIGIKGGYGNAIVLRHANVYSTLYGHLSRFEEGLKKGDSVRQGQVIGYVGQTGLATGPHLHYEFRVNGVHRDPVTVRFPQTRSLPPSERSQFLTAIGPLSEALSAKPTLIASARDIGSD